MKYNNTVEATFLERPNRFIAKVKIENEEHTVHVKNTGRCKEILIKDSTVILEKSDNPNRKTLYDLIAVYKKGFGLINIDSQAPNKVVKEWLDTKDFDYIKPEFKYGESRIDFYMEKGNEKYLMEVKGCTLERDHVGYFPDAPTQRGVRHLRELIKATKEGYKTAVCFVIQMENVSVVLANSQTDPEFDKALNDAKAAGVEIIFLKCKVAKDTLEFME